MIKINLSRAIPCRALGIRLDPITQKRLTRERHLYRKALKLQKERNLTNREAEALVNIHNQGE